MFTHTYVCLMYVCIYNYMHMSAHTHSPEQYTVIYIQSYIQHSSPMGLFPSERWEAASVWKNFHLNPGQQIWSFPCSEMTLSPAAWTCLRVVSDSSIRGRMQRWAIKEANGSRVSSNISDIRSKKDLQYSTKLGHDQNIWVMSAGVWEHLSQISERIHLH